jgi:transposase
MQKSIMVGLDLHAETMTLKVAGAGMKVQTREYSSAPVGRRRMFGDLLEMAQAAGGVDIYLAYEASGMGFRLYDEAVEQGIRCYVLAPTKIRRSVNERKAKTDSKDAEQLLEVLKAHVLAGNAIPSVWVPDPTTRDDRELVRARLDVGEQAAMVRVKIRSLLRRHEIRVPSTAGRGWTKGFLGFLDRLTVKGQRLKPGAQEALSSLLRHLEFLEKEVHRLEKKLDELSEGDRYREPVRELTKIKGVGQHTALVYLTEMGDLSRFSNRRKVGKYVGLVPATYESGKSGERKGHITHQGSSRVRKVLCQAVWARVRSDSGEKTVYERIVKKNPRHKKVGVVALMRRLAIQMWHVGLEAQRRAGVVRVSGHKQAA